MRQVWPLKSGLRKAFVLLQCSKKTHNDCRRIRDALIDGTSGYVQSAYTTDAVVDGRRYCVAASALVPGEEAEKFRRRVRRIRTGGKLPVTVKHIELTMDDRD